MHPRTRRRIEQFGINTEKLHLLEPLPYIEFLSLQRCAAVVITDSGGIQEETTFLQVPCLTMRNNTERPVTVDMGTNVLVGQDLGLLNSELKRFSKEKPRRDRYRRCGTAMRGRGLLKRSRPTRLGLNLRCDPFELGQISEILVWGAAEGSGTRYIESACR